MEFRNINKKIRNRTDVSRILRKLLYRVALLEIQSSGSGSSVTNTSQLTNDGENGINPFITINDVGSLGGKFVTGDNPTDAVYTGGYVGIGKTNPNEALDITGNAGNGGIKYNYTYTDNATVDMQTGGENIASELGVPSGNIQGLMTNYKNDPRFPTLQIFDLAGDFKIAGAQKVFGVTKGVFNLTATSYAGIWAHPLFTQTPSDDEFELKFKVMNEEDDHAHTHLKTKGYESEISPMLGYSEEALYERRVSNTEGDINFIWSSPHETKMTSLLKLTGYGLGTFVENYTHSDDAVKTGTAATIIGSPTYLLAVDANGTTLEHPVVSGLAIRTGSTILFDTPSEYNAVTPLTTGDITLDATGAIHGVDTTVFFNGATEPTILGGLTFNIITGVFEANKLIAYNFIYNTNGNLTLNIMVDEQ